MFRLIIFTLIGLFAILMLRGTPEIATRHRAALPPAPHPANATGEAGQSAQGALLARTTPTLNGAVAVTPADAAVTATGQPSGWPALRPSATSFLASILASDSALRVLDGVAGSWIEIRDAAGNRSFIPRHATNPAPR